MQGGKQNCFALLQGVAENLSISHLKDSGKTLGPQRVDVLQCPAGSRASRRLEVGSVRERSVSGDTKCSTVGL